MYGLYLNFPAPVCYESDHEHLSTVWGSLTNHHHIGCFSFGYGFSFIRSSWDYIKEEYEEEITVNTLFDDDLLSESIHYRHHLLGLCFPMNLRLLPAFNMGVFYRPSLFILGKSGGFQYEPLIRFELSWKIRLRKPRSK